VVLEADAVRAIGVRVGPKVKNTAGVIKTHRASREQKLLELARQENP
jgi:hypothetical protein